MKRKWTPDELISDWTLQASESALTCHKLAACRTKLLRSLRCGNHSSFILEDFAYWIIFISWHSGLNII